MNMLWWHRLAGGLLLIGLELFIPSFTIVWFGLGAILVGIVLAIYPGSHRFGIAITLDLGDFYEGNNREPRRMREAGTLLAMLLLKNAVT